MFSRSKVQEMIAKWRSRTVNGASAQRSHVTDQRGSPYSTVPCDSGSKSASPRGALFASSRLLLSHSTSLPAGSVSGPDAESETAFSASPTSVLDAAAFAPGSDGKRRPWREGMHGLADALDCGDEGRSVVVAALVRSCSLDRRVEFGVKNKSAWVPLREPAAASGRPGETGTEMEPSSEDYTCVICRGPNPKTVHIFGDRVVESSPQPINLAPARREGGLLSW